MFYFQPFLWFLKPITIDSVTEFSTVARFVKPLTVRKEDSRYEIGTTVTNIICVLQNTGDNAIEKIMHVNKLKEQTKSS